MTTDFDIYAAKGNELLKMLADELHVPPHTACHILRAVLHAIRNHLSVNESLQLIAQFPMMVKALYVEQWRIPQHSERIHHVHQFLEEIQQYDGRRAGYDFGNNASTGKVAQIVIRCLSHYISTGEFDDILAVLPKEISAFVQGSIDSDWKIL